MYHNQAHKEEHLPGRAMTTMDELASLQSQGVKRGLQNRQSSQEMLADVTRSLSPADAVLGQLTSTIDDNAKVSSEDAREVSENAKPKRSKAYIHMPK